MNNDTQSTSIDEEKNLKFDKSLDSRWFLSPLNLIAMYKITFEHAIPSLNRNRALKSDRKYGMMYFLFIYGESYGWTLFSGLQRRSTDNEISYVRLKSNKNARKLYAISSIRNGFQCNRPFCTRIDIADHRLVHSGRWKMTNDRNT